MPFTVFRARSDFKCLNLRACYKLLLSEDLGRVEGSEGIRRVND